MYIVLLVDWFNVQFNCCLLVNLYLQCYIVGIVVFQCIVDFMESGLVFQFWVQCIQCCLICYVSGYVMQSVVCFKGWWQVGGIGWVKFDLCVVEGGKCVVVGVVGQVKIVYEFSVVVQVVYVKFQFFNFGNIYYLLFFYCLVV